MSIKNPLFIPENYKEISKDGEETRYESKIINGRNIRVIEYRNKEGLLVRANVWGICGELKEFRDGFVAYDENIDFKAERELREPVESMYPKPVVITFF